MDYDAAAIERVAQRFRGDAWRSVPLEAVNESEIEVQGFGPVLATCFGELDDIRCLNQIQGAAEPGAVEDGRLGEAVEWMQEREVDYGVPVAVGRPGTAAAEEWLRSCGHDRHGGWLKMVRDGSPPQLFSTPGIAVYEIGGESGDGEGMSEIAAEALGLPLMAETLFFGLSQEAGWRCYTAALEGGELIATGSTLIVDGIAQLSPGATLEWARGMGANTALLRRRLIDAARAGCHTCFVEIGEADLDSLATSSRILRRAGFEWAYSSHNWQRPVRRTAGVY
jgi:hypothetical protein